jgi:hypothetical protein
VQRRALSYNARTFFQKLTTGENQYEVFRAKDICLCSNRFFVRVRSSAANLDTGDAGQNQSRRRAASFA